jgi:hypothetical protein
MSDDFNDDLTKKSNLNVTQIDEKRLQKEAQPGNSSKVEKRTGGSTEGPKVDLAQSGEDIEDKMRDIIRVTSTTGKSPTVEEIIINASGVKSIKPSED